MTHWTFKGLTVAPERSHTIIPPSHPARIMPQMSPMRKDFAWTMPQCQCCPPQQPWWQHFTQWRRPLRKMTTGTVERKKEKKKMNRNNNHLTDMATFNFGVFLNGSGCKRKMLTDTASESTLSGYSCKVILLSWGNFWSDVTEVGAMRAAGSSKVASSHVFFFGFVFQTLPLRQTRECTGCENAAWSVITSRSKRLQEYPECGAHWPCTTVDARGIATPNHGTRTHLWLEVYYKIPPSAAVPMRTEQKFQGKEWRWHIIQGFHPSDAVWRCFILIIFFW